jgi:hypothetical protein
MAKGSITFEFDTLADLARQMRMLLVDEVRGELDRAMGLSATVKSAVHVSSPSLATTEAGGAVGGACVENGADLTVAPTEIPEQVHQINRETIAVAAAMSTMIKEAKAPAKRDAPDITLENLATAPYPELLAFCECTPEVGVDVSKSQPPFFRKLVEMKIKTYLESK